ncbi:hypothetical protein SDC9_07403 [bioreactor metagenome]|uniref:Uncharacterized protein n=1 Tax=bioreactor metagenome TaxID=1076179 RepID=A0A644T4S4_9ZZZZ|nr:hypothetical protein [Methanobrevibacter sp.]MEA4956858.1 hypothetical protein [Methanobrevibacter sp.]
MNIKGIVLAKRDNQYDVRLENTTRNIITYVENTTGLELEIGDIVIVTYTDYNDPPIITNVYDKTISGADSYTKTETNTLLGYKEDKVSGKGLSSNDYTNTDKSKVDISVPNTLEINSKPLNTNITLTKSDIGLGNVDNTSDTNKPISTSTQTALNNKVDKITGKQLSTEDYTTIEKNKLNTVASGAEVNIQADWNQTNSTQDDYIKNKPTIPTEETANTILTKLLTVDGAGSGLDADLLDGNNSNYFATASSVSSIPVIYTGSFTISSVTANTNATTEITMPSAASVSKCVFWTSGGIAPYYIYCSTNSGTTWTIQHRWFGTSTNRIVYYAYW